MAKRIIITVFSIIATVLAGLFVFLKTTIYHPKGVEQVEVIQLRDAESYDARSPLKILSYNVQYFAGKGYVFFYDLPEFSGPDTRPSHEAIAMTLESVSEIILKEDPDVVLLQEVDEGASRTDHENQTLKLLDLLGKKYANYAECFYWKARYVPYPKIAGSVGMKLTTLSKYPIISAKRHQLPRIRENYITSQFNFYRAVLETTIELNPDETVTCLNTHLDAFPDSPETMQKQVSFVINLLDRLEKENLAWIIGGDFNLLAPGEYQRMVSKYGYSADTELSTMFDRWHSIPSLKNIQGEGRERWFTHFPNNPDVKAPDRIIDYIFYSDQLAMLNSKVIQGKSWEVSDHLPVIGEFQITSH